MPRKIAIDATQVQQAAESLEEAKSALEAEAARWPTSRLVSIITLRNRRIFQLADYHTLQLEEISLLVHF